MSVTLSSSGCRNGAGWHPSDLRAGVCVDRPALRNNRQHTPPLDSAPILSLPLQLPRSIPGSYRCLHTTKMEPERQVIVPLVQPSPRRHITSDPLREGSQQTADGNMWLTRIPTALSPHGLNNAVASRSRTGACQQATAIATFIVRTARRSGLVSENWVPFEESSMSSQILYT